MTVEEIVERVRALSCGHVVLTGGEPMAAAGVEELTRRLRDAGLHLTIETAGTVWKDVVCNLASVSPKLANSTPWSREGGRYAEAHEKNRIHVETIRRFMGLDDYQLKFVVDGPRDAEEIDELLSRIGGCEPSNVLLMPQGVTAEWEIENGEGGSVGGEAVEFVGLAAPGAPGVGGGGGGES
jgi:7-carboxy-7-deazaguanine synthase